jgi:PEGA domain
VKTGTDPVKTGTDPVKTGTDPVKTGTDPVKTGTDPIKSGTPVKTGTDPVKSGTPVKTGTDPIKSGPGQVTVILEGTPKGAIFVDGKLVGRGLARATISLAPGDHLIRGQSPMHKPAVATVHVSAGGKATIKLMLKKQGGGVNGAVDPFATGD